MVKALFPMTLLLSVCCTKYWGCHRISQLLNLVTILGAERVEAEVVWRWAVCSVFFTKKIIGKQGLCRACQGTCRQARETRLRYRQDYLAGALWRCQGTCRQARETWLRYRQDYLAGTLWRLPRDQ